MGSKLCRMRNNTTDNIETIEDKYNELQRQHELLKLENDILKLKQDNEILTQDYKNLTQDYDILKQDYDILNMKVCELEGEREREREGELEKEPETLDISKFKIISIKTGGYRCQIGNEERMYYSVEIDHFVKYAVLKDEFRDLNFDWEVPNEANKVYKVDDFKPKVSKLYKITNYVNDLNYEIVGTDPIGLFTERCVSINNSVNNPNNLSITTDKKIQIFENFKSDLF